MTQYHVAGIGNAIVDVLTQSDDAFLSKMGIEKGIMQLIERDRAELLYDAMDERTQIAGGSVGNTIAGLGAMGLDTAFIGRVRDDELGRAYAADMKAAGSAFPNAPVKEGELPTSRCMIFVSPDGERSMNTYLGISSEVGPDDVDESVPASAKLLFLEGYLYDKPKGKLAFEAAARACRASGGKAGIALSDPFCVDRHRGDFRKLVRDLDYVIGNEHEWRSLYETDDLGAALEQAAAESGMIVCTRSGHDVVIVRGDEEAVAPVKTITPVDATGAGDQFAAGFLYGIAKDYPLEVAGRMGCAAAAEVISHVGARPEANMLDIFRTEGLI
ncbi:adenosine kinase [Aquicoccus sp. SCR17]|nr:adenosine kinase [Carideicomes alvinocaridis]